MPNQWRGAAKPAATKTAQPAPKVGATKETDKQALAKREANLELPAPVRRRNIDEAQWRTLCGSLYPGAKSESILAVIDYCRARHLDPMKKPCHIVPMEVKVAGSNRYEWRDVVMAGIYEYRTTAIRTGKYLGHSPYKYGEDLDQFGVTAPEWCEVTIYRHHPSAGKIEFPVRVYFAEVVALKDDKANKRWSKAPRQMLTKCTEAAGLREAFPDEFGGTHTLEEMEGHRIESPDEAPQGPKPATRRSEKEEAPMPGVQEGEFTEGTEEASTAGDATEERERGGTTDAPSGETGGEQPEIPEEQEQDQREDDPRHGMIVEVQEGLGQNKDAATVKLSTGFICSTRVPDMIAAAKNLRDGGRTVELVTTAANRPNTMDRLDEILPQ